MSSTIATSEAGQSNLSLVASCTSANSTCRSIRELKERNYMGISDCSSVESCVASNAFEEKETTLNLKATELRLGLPGSPSPERELKFSLLSYPELDENPVFPFASMQKIISSGNKRGFSDVIIASNEGKLCAYQGTNPIMTSRPSTNSTVIAATSINQSGPSKVLQEKPDSGCNIGNAPATKTQVVGWPPIRSFRKNTLATGSKCSEEVDGKPISGSLFVKVSMDGAPYLRKVDLKIYFTYVELCSALEKMFCCFIIAPERDVLSESKLRDLLHGSEYVLTYEDRDGDWMLVGDVPWKMFLGSCRRLRIMKSSDAIGLAPRVMEKSENGK